MRKEITNPIPIFTYGVTRSKIAVPEGTYAANVTAGGTAGYPEGNKAGGTAGRMAAVARVGPGLDLVEAHA